ncbi:MAG TPA: SDR family oxidoreductase [Chromatiaceae bacterium]|jgi:3-oxoacyl-[acyl-carrier protein] reductase|nr:MAG: hypothetical protein N838_03865 [Thiohalocapsa sp. PB-PSB1]QQO52200.1 MAG: SDR family oxidoreductase [Thiohalocapsa sp. PB-PSB1]HBG95604.1 SDR family oxidoreductase [Chromatiaceae bacterium]HCS90160.1 SDR family NAD(P)-dependent oxidoreductase [Chromatiaceae bacterium]
MRCLVITGASSGIGRAIAVRFLRDGFSVVNLSRRVCPESEVDTLCCDLSKPGAVDGIKKRLRARLQDAEAICLVHNASAMRRDSVSDLTDAALRQVLELNLVAPTALNQIVLPLMKPGSSLIYVGSTLAQKAVPGAASYVIAKHGLIGMMRAACQDLAGRGIHTCAICPGFTDTEQLRALTANDADTLASLAAMSAFDRLIEPDEIADTLAFAARSPVLNGAVIHANLGQRER